VSALDSELAALYMSGTNTPATPRSRPMRYVMYRELSGETFTIANMCGCWVCHRSASAPDACDGCIGLYCSPACRALDSERHAPACAAIRRMRAQARRLD
jgi:hypothetical protein